MGIKSLGYNSKSIIVSYISIFFTLISGLLYTPWLIRVLGTSDYAIYSIGTSLMIYFTVDFGIGATLTRFIARYRSAGEENKVKGLLGLSLKMYLVIDAIALVALVVLYFFISNIFRGLSPEEIDNLKVVYLILAFMTVMCIPVMPLNGIYIAHGRIYNVKLFDLLNKAVTILFVCLALLCGYRLYAVVLINALVTIVINIVKLVYIWKKEHLSVDMSFRDRGMLRHLLGFSLWVSVAMIADKFFFSIEPTLLGVFSNSTQVAIFAVASQIEGYVLLMADGLNGIFLPQVTDMVVKKEPTSKITDLMSRVGRLQLIIVTMMVLLLLTQGREFIHIWFGDDYSLSYFVVMIIFVPCFVHMTQGIGSELVFATNNVRYRALAFVAGAIVNVVVTMLLAPRYGAIGAAVGIASGFTVGHECIMNIVYYKVLKLDIRRFFRQCHLPMILPAAVMSGLGYLFSLLPLHGLLGFIVKCALFVICFILIVYFFYANKAEKAQVKSILSSFISIS